MEPNILAGLIFVLFFVRMGKIVLNNEWQLPIRPAFLFFNKYSDCRSHFLATPYQCMFINCIYLPSLSFFEVLLFLHRNCLFSLFLVMCSNPKHFSAKFLLSDNYLATLHLSFVLEGITFSYLLWLF